MSFNDLIQMVPAYKPCNLLLNLDDRSELKCCTKLKPAMILYNIIIIIIIVIKCSL